MFKVIFDDIIKCLYFNYPPGQAVGLILISGLISKLQFSLNQDLKSGEGNSDFKKLNPDLQNKSGFKPKSKDENEPLMSGKLLFC